VGETQEQPFQLSFNSLLKVDFQGSRVTSDGGLVLVRELDERLGFGELIARHLTDSRGKNSQLPLADLLRQSVYSRLAGYEDLNDAARLSQDPTFRLIGSRKIWERGAALTSRLQSFETELLTEEGNLAGLAALNRELVARAATIDPLGRVVLDMDSTEIRVYGQQEQSAYNGPLRVDLLSPAAAVQSRGGLSGRQAAPRQRPQRRRLGGIAAARDRAPTRAGQRVVFRADAAFAKPEIYEALEARDVKYAIRLPANDNLQRNITELLTRPVGRPSNKPVVWFKSFRYQAASWTTARRVRRSNSIVGNCSPAWGSS
jgi:hypothetical protein